MNLQQLLKQAREMQERLERQLAELEVEGSAGGGMVTVVMTGTKRIKRLTIDPEVVSKDELPLLQDLIVAAIHDAQRKVDETLAAEMGGLMGALQLPGLG